MTPPWNSRTTALPERKSHAFSGKIQIAAGRFDTTIFRHDKRAVELRQLLDCATQIRMVDRPDLWIVSRERIGRRREPIGSASEQYSFSGFER
jgi:hypothetical protein